MSFQLTVNLDTVYFVDCAHADVRCGTICLAGLATMQVTFFSKLIVHHMSMLLIN